MPSRQSMNHNTYLHYILCFKICHSDKSKVLTKPKVLDKHQHNALFHILNCISLKC